MKQLILLAPEIFLSTLALAVLVGEAFWPQRNKLWLSTGVGGLTLVGLHQMAFFATGQVPGAAALGFSPLVREGWVQYNTVFGMMAVDSLAVFFKLTVIAAVI